MTCVELHELLAEYERSIKELSELLVTELALRDELDYDKELKNTFISLLLSIQKKRRDTNADRKKKKIRNNQGQSVGADAVSPTSETSSTVSVYSCMGLHVYSWLFMWHLDVLMWKITDY